MISSPRLALRPYRIEDFEAYSEMVAASGLTREDAWNRLLRYIGHWEVFGFGLFAALDGQTGVLVGEAGLARFGRNLGPAFDEAPEASWTVAPAARGRGLASEAAEHAHAWFEGAFGRKRTVCLVDRENAASMRVAAKLGYTAFSETTYRGTSFVMLERSVSATA